MTNLTDKEVVEKIIQDPENLTILIKKYEAPLGRYIRRITNIPKEEIDDLLQDIFISVYQNINSYDPELQFSSWIYRIAHNKTINHWKKNKKIYDNLSIDENPFVYESNFHTKDFLEDFEIRDRKNELSRALRNINEKYREILILKFIEGKDYKEISDILEKPMGTIATMINRGKKALKKEIEKYNENNKTAYDK